MRKRLRLGPATILALATAIVVATVKWPEYQEENRKKQAMQQLREEIAQRKVEPPKAARTLANLWTHRSELRLTPPQIAAMQILRDAETRDAAPAQRETEHAAQEFERWMREARQRGATLDEIKQRSAPVSEASKPLIEIRRAYFNRALAQLAPAQRAQVEKTFQ